MLLIPLDFAAAIENFQGKQAENLQTEIEEMELDRKQDQEDTTDCTVEMCLFCTFALQQLYCKTIELGIRG